MSRFVRFRLSLSASLLAAALSAQTDTAALIGLVRDATGGTVANAKVRLQNRGTGAVREQTTRDNGLYEFEVLPPGEYELTVEAPGFKQFRDTQARVQVAQISRLDVQLEVGSASEFVEVQGTVSPLNAESVTQGTVIGEQKILQLPLNGRQFVQLALLVPGTNGGGRAVQQNAVRQGETGGLSISGGRTNNTAFLLDGAANVDPDYSSINYSPQIDSIGEFQVQTALVSAEYGRASINVVTKSGSNELHGSAFEFLRNNDLDTRPFNLPGATAQFQRNQFGATVGGPIVKNKLFGFFAYEGLRVRQAAASLTTTPLPSALQRKGDFSQTKGGIFDPDTLANGVRVQFPGNIVPTSRINPLAAAAMNAMPLPSDPAAGTFVNSSEALQQNNDNYSGRVDYTINSKWNLFSRYSIGDEDALIPGVVPGRETKNPARTQHAVLGATGVLKSNIVNEARFGFSRLRVTNGTPEPTFDVNGQRVELPQFQVNPYPLMGGAGAFTTTITGGGISLVRNNTFQFYDNVSWNVGRHSVKFGGGLYWVQYNRFEAPNNLGRFQFTSGFTTRTAKNDGTGDALASMLLGLPATSSRSVGPSRIDGRQQQASLYIQDDFRVSPSLTLNIGLRYEVAPPLHDAHQQMSSIDYSTAPSPQQSFATGKTGVANATLFVCGQSGYPAGCAYTDKNNFAPRLGVVWAANPKTVIKAGGGVFYANNDDNPLFRLAAGLPDNIAQTLSSDNFIPQYHNLNPFGANVVGPVQIQAAGIDLHQRTSYSLQWNFSVQRELSRNMVLEAGYLATLGIKLEQNVQPNNAMPGPGAIDPRRPYLGVQYAPNTQFPSYITVVGNTVPVGQINYLPHSAQSNYESLFVRFERRFSRGVSFLSSYTWSKAITNAPQYRNAGGAQGNENSPPQDSYNLAAERGLASFNAAHRWINTFLFDLPALKDKGLVTKMLGDIQLSGILSIQTGFPFTVNLAGDTAGIGGGTGGILIRPNYVLGQPVDLSGSQRSTGQWFNTAAFIAPPAFAFGDLGRNTVTGPGLTNLDAALAKNIAIREGLKLQFRAECFNLFNHSNYNLVGRIFNDPTTFGKVLSQLDPREFQFGLKLVF
jgi:Carboxypeptidase regulatory-like domain/TonB dependent receptor